MGPGSLRANYSKVVKLTFKVFYLQCHLLKSQIQMFTLTNKLKLIF